jgi:hypothetical protein
MTHRLRIVRATSTALTIAYSLAVLMVSFELALSAEAQQKPRRLFPAKIEIVSTKQVDGRRELEVVLVPDEGVHIYAHPEINTPIVDLSIHSADGARVSANIVYLKSEEKDGRGVKHDFAGKLRYTISFKAPTNDVGLKLNCRLAANSRRMRCLGYGSISTDVPTK